MGIYQSALAGQRLSVPVRYEALEARAKEVMSPEAFDYVAGGAGSEATMRANLDAFQRWRIRPRMLRDVSARSLATTLLGQKLGAPVLLAPVGVQNIVHPDGEIAVARAAASVDVPIVLSGLSSFPMEQVAQAMGSTPRWFQLYWSSERDILTSLVQRAERAGYSAIVVTVDSTTIGWRERDLTRAYLPFLQGHGLGNYFSDPVFRAGLSEPPEQNPIPAIQRCAALFGHAAPRSWEDLRWLRSQTSLPILPKGVLRADDAARAVDEGMNGIVVSNHGGRQVDGSVASLEALPEIVEAVRNRIPILLDSGIRRGSDAFKALALGADAVLLGRPYVWGLGCAGQAGVRDVVLNFLADLDLAFGLSGYAGPGDLDEQAIVGATQ